MRYEKARCRLLRPARGRVIPFDAARGFPGPLLPARWRRVRFSAVFKSEISQGPGTQEGRGSSASGTPSGRRFPFPPEFLQLARGSLGALHSRYEPLKCFVSVRCEARIPRKGRYRLFRSAGTVSSPSEPQQAVGCPSFEPGDAYPNFDRFLSARIFRDPGTREKRDCSASGAPSGRQFPFSLKFFPLGQGSLGTSHPRYEPVKS